MEIEIKKLDESKVKIRMRLPLGKEVKQIRNKLGEMHKKAKKAKEESSDDKEMSEFQGIWDYMEFIDKITIKCAYLEGKNIDIDFLDNLEQDQKEKLTSVVGIAALGESDFSKHLGKQLN